MLRCRLYSFSPTSCPQSNTNKLDTRISNLYYVKSPSMHGITRVPVRSPTGITGITITEIMDAIILLKLTYTWQDTR